MANGTNVLWDTKWTTTAYGTTGSWEVEIPAYGDYPAQTVKDVNQGGFQNYDPLGTAVLISLFTDARLPDYMIGLFGFTIDDQREWHGNTFSIEGEEEPLGSLLWTLRRAPADEYTCRLAEHFCSEALQPLIHQGLASRFEVQAYFPDEEMDPVNMVAGVEQQLEMTSKVTGHMIIYIVAYGTVQGDREFTADLYAMR